MKEKRNLSGIYFRSKNEEGKWDNIVFEDLSKEEQDKILDNYTKEQVSSLAKILANTLNTIGEQFDLIC